MNREVKAVCVLNEDLLILTHFFSFPWSNRSVKDTQSSIWKNEFSVDTEHVAKAFTLFTSTEGTVKREEMFVGLVEAHAIAFEFIGEPMCFVFVMNEDGAFTLTFFKSSFYRVGYTKKVVFVVICNCESVDEKKTRLR